MDGGRSGCRGRGKPVDKPPQPPDKAILDKISQEKGVAIIIVYSTFLVRTNAYFL